MSRMQYLYIAYHHVHPKLIYEVRLLIQQQLVKHKCLLIYALIILRHHLLYLCLIMNKMVYQLQLKFYHYEYHM